MEAVPLFNSILEPQELTQFFRSIRRASCALIATLSDADAEYRVFDERFNFLFNSYYESIGARHARPKRGLLTRPTLDGVCAYREYVDAAIERLLQRQPPASVTQLVEFGCHHEQQNQELLLTDILHLFAQNPLKPAYKPPEPLLFEAQALSPPAYRGFEGGTVEIGHEGGGFAFDCEGPRHRVFVEPYRLADRLVSNREWIEFMVDGGYQNPLLWLAEGWTEMCLQGWTMPLYWERRDDTYWTMTLRGSQPVDLDAPVSHVSYFEADAFATWSGRRLPTEAEWEHAAQDRSPDGNFADSGRLRPKRMSSGGDGMHQLFGDVWEWTRSAFQPYPRFRAAAGAVGEYNGKFMSGQFVLRGGSCVTPAGHIRASYRNFFPPATRWQFSGVRLAEDVEASPRFQRGLNPLRDPFRADVLFGLGQFDKALSSRWLYDVHGSELFEEITRLPEYYPTRTETGIIQCFASEIADFVGENVSTLIPAYNDAAGTTAHFNLNLLTRINRELGGDFVLERFQHHVRWNEAETAIEMHLVSVTEHIATVSGVQFAFAAGESIHTESSRKYGVSDFTAVAAEHGWRIENVWTDEKQLFGMFGLVSLE